MFQKLLRHLETFQNVLENNYEKEFFFQILGCAHGLNGFRLIALLLMSLKGNAIQVAYLDRKKHTIRNKI